MLLSSKRRRAVFNIFFYIQTEIFDTVSKEKGIRFSAHNLSDSPAAVHKVTGFWVARSWTICKQFDKRI